MPSKFAVAAGCPASRESSFLSNSGTGCFVFYDRHVEKNGGSSMKVTSVISCVACR